jgi:tRNA threonylcarbamoyl adenosine modification protein YjeE
MKLPITFSEKDLPDLVGRILMVLSEALVSKNIVLVGLTGDLGAGKTTLCKEMLKQLGVSKQVVSPTFVLRKDYEGMLKGEEVQVVHIDAYRLEKKEQIGQVLEITPDSSLDKEGRRMIVLVEWAELADLVYDFHFQIKHMSESEREISNFE